MQKNQPREEPVDALHPAHQLDAQSVVTTVTSQPLSRRSFLTSAGAGAAVASTAGVGASLLLSENAKADDDFAPRAEQSFQIRLRAAAAERAVPTPRHVNNGDEARYDNFIGNYTQGLPHSGIGEVDPNAYAALLAAVTMVTAQSARAL